MAIIGHTSDGTPIDDLVLRRPMTPEQMREQRISFVYGNIGMSNPSITREMVERVVDNDARRSVEGK